MFLIVLGGFWFWFWFVSFPAAAPDLSPPKTQHNAAAHAALPSSASLCPNKTKQKQSTKNQSYEILTRTADGDEGGRHQIISAGVAGGKLWILKVQVGDKRWFKGVDKDAIGAADSFTLA